MEIRKVGVVGCGLMGSGIAQVSATSGFETMVREVSSEFLEKGLRRIETSLKKSAEKGKLAPEQMQESLRRLHGTLKLEELSDCDLIIDAVTEDFQVKKETFEALDQRCKQSAIFASNTSSLSITQLMMTTRRPDRFVGLHFFNPVPVMKLVEVVRTLATSDEVFETSFEFARSLGKQPVRCEDRTGFLVNRLLVPYLLDAIRAYEEGTGSMEDIDLAMKLGCGYPMGPFQLLDFVGLDTTYHIANIMFEEFREKRFAPPPLLKRLVMAGRYGRKSGKGFYDYSDQ